MMNKSQEMLLICSTYSFRFCPDLSSSIVCSTRRAYRDYCLNIFTLINPSPFENRTLDLETNQKWPVFLPFLGYHHPLSLQIKILFFYYHNKQMKADSDEQIENQDKRNPVKRAEREKEFRTVGQLKDVITDATLMQAKLQEYAKTFKSVKNTHPTKKELTIIDFSLAARGPQEDEVYTFQPFYRNNIRRGNTIVFNSKTKQAEWARRGLMKFFDISDKALYAIVNSDIAGLPKHHQPLYYNIFGEIENVLSCNDELQPKDKAKVHVHRLNKANGENCQVSYFATTDEWVVSSKNVSVFVREPADVKLYKEERYQFAALMAEQWFALIADRKQEELQGLKKALTGKTLVGEYCGNPDFQHLVKYNEITIYFYAVVENNSTSSCIPPPQAFALLEQYHLPIVKNHEKSYFGEFTVFTEFGQALIKLFNEVATSSIFEDEEGSVVYFVLEKPKAFCEYVSDRYLQNSVPIPADWASKEVHYNVASLGKLKTLEYRILRKLREKLKYYTRVKKGGEQSKEKATNDQKKLEERYGSFEKEVHSLVKGKTLTKPLEYYFCAAIIAFDYVFKNRKNQRNLALLSDHYLDFLSVIFWAIENKREVTVALMNDQQLHRELRGTNWADYSVEIVKDYPEMLEKFAPRFAKIKKSMGFGQEEEEIEKEEEDN